MKTSVSQLTGTDILCTYTPARPTLAIVDTEICFVEQVIMLKAATDDTIPQQAFVVVTRRGERFVEIDHDAPDYNGTAWALAPSVPHVEHFHTHITFDQVRFLTKNVMTLLQGEAKFSAVCDHIRRELRLAGISAVCDHDDEKYRMSTSAPEFDRYLRTVYEQLVEEIKNESCKPGCECKH